MPAKRARPGGGRRGKAAGRGRAKRQAWGDFSQKARRLPLDPCRGRRTRKVLGKSSERVVPTRIARQGSAQPRPCLGRLARPRPRSRQAKPREIGCALNSPEIKGSYQIFPQRPSSNCSAHSDAFPVDIKEPPWAYAQTNSSFRPVPQARACKKAATCLSQNNHDAWRDQTDK